MSDSHQPPISDDGRWMWDGTNWVAIPRVVAPEAPNPGEVDALPEQWSYVPTLTATNPVAFGEGIVVENSALSLVNDARDRAYGLTLLFSVILAVTLTALNAYQRVGVERIPEVFVDVFLADHLIFTGALLGGSQVALFVLRRLLAVRLYWPPLYQALLCVAAAGAASSYFFNPFV